MTRYPFAFQSRYRPTLSAIGVFSNTSWVDVEDDGIHARFGLISADVDYDNISDVELTGPYSAIKAIGARVSLADRGLTMGTTTMRGVCLRFKEPILGIDPTGTLKHPGLTVTVADTADFVDDVRARAGLPIPTRQ